jgi:F-type H+-transporting ATPase subunit gamma
MTSVQKTMRITNAMYLMASSKLKRARRQLEAVEPYYKRLQATIVDILAHTDEGSNRYFATDREIPEDEVKHAFIIITSDKGLAGSYNHNVIQLAEQELRKCKTPSKLCFIGYAGRNYFLKHPELGTVQEELCHSAVEASVWRSRNIAEYLIEDFLAGEIDEAHVVYTKMVNAMTVETECIQILPLAGKMFPYEPSEDDWTYVTDYMPSARAVLEELVPNYVKGILYGAMTEAFAAEQNARMMAMDNATKNAGEIAKDLALQYNRVRQAAITTEITEVVSGANAQRN